MKRSFSISPRILSHLGEDLIKNESIALLELVKNSYDACAKECVVEFIVSEENKFEKIIITDNGFGMDRRVIEDVWLTIGTDNKFKSIKKNECGRLPLGEKGIGRLGVHKLGNKIQLITKKKSSKEVALSIDWNKLKDSKSIDDFEIDIIEREPRIFKNKPGTKIIIEDLKTNWDRREIREVYRNLISLNSPFSRKTSESFRVFAKSNSKIFEGLPEFEDIRKNALYIGYCKMAGDKIIDFKYEFKPWDTLVKVDRGRKVQKKDLLKEELNLIDENENKLNLNKYKIGPIEFDLVIFDNDAQILNYSNVEKKTVREFLTENGGIRVYRDGVRVYNFGERDNDWLGIDLRRVHRVGGNVSNNIIVGAVRLSRAESFGLREKTNREGFIEDDSYHAFVSAVNYALSLLVRQRNVDKEILTTLYKKHKTIEPVLSDLSEAIEVVEEKVDDEKVKEELLKYLGRINSQYIEVKEILIKSANAGLNLGIVIHEIDKLISQLIGAIERNERTKAVNISQMLEKIVRGYSAMIKKSTIKETPVATVVKIALDNYEFRFLDHKISVIHNSKESDLTGFLAEAEAISCLTNLLDNSVFWLSYSKPENRTISIYITDQIKNYTSIVVSDNGPGFNIPVDVATKPFITGKPHNIGSGLGLHVVSEMMKAMKGQLMFLDKNDINLPKTVKDRKAEKAIIALCFPKKK